MQQSNERVRVALIGCGAIALANHLRGLAHCPAAKVTALCDTDPSALERARLESGVETTYTDYRELLRDGVADAAVLATPNRSHAEIASAAVRAGLHILCEKPLAMNLDEARRMTEEAEEAGLRHMTAFTYRFVPAMRYIAHLVGSGLIGEPRHFRAQRFQDWGDRGLGWRQQAALAGSGELGDMLSHRIDFAHLLVGEIAEVAADVRTFVPERGGAPSDVEDWVAVLARFTGGATGVLESTKLASGHGEGARSTDHCEVNGTDATVIYSLQRPLEVQIGKTGARGLESRPVPAEFLKLPDSPRDPGEGDPAIVFRYDQNVEFISAILEQRPCRPSFHDGVRAQAVMDAILRSARLRSWVTVAPVEAPV